MQNTIPAVALNATVFDISSVDTEMPESGIREIGSIPPSSRVPSFGEFGTEYANWFADSVLGSDV